MGRKDTVLMMSPDHMVSSHKSISSRQSLLYYLNQIGCKPAELCHSNVIFAVLQSVFSVVDPHPDIYLVARIEKVLQGGVNANTEPYVRNPDVKVGSKIHRAMRLYCHKLGHYRMPFAWAVKLVYIYLYFVHSVHIIIDT